MFAGFWPLVFVTPTESTPGSAFFVFTGAQDFGAFSVFFHLFFDVSGIFFYQTFEQHFEKYVAAYEERFEPRSGPLRHVVPEAVVQFLACGPL